MIFFFFAKLLVSQLQQSRGSRSHVKRKIKSSKWQIGIIHMTKTEGWDYISCSVNNLLSKYFAIVQVMELEQLMFTLLPPKTFSKHFRCFDCEFPCTRSKSNRLAEGRGGFSLQIVSFFETDFCFLKRLSQRRLILHLYRQKFSSLYKSKFWVSI